MPNKIEELFQKIKKGGKTRTLRLLLFLILVIALPIILTAPQKQQILQQNAQASTSLPIYGIDANVLDGLANNWVSHITFGTATALDLANKSPTYKNSPHSIRYTVTAPFDGFDLTAPNIFDISPYNYLNFYVQAGAPGQRFYIVTIEASGQPYSLPVEPISPPVGYWSLYTIPIAQLGIIQKNILGIGFQDANGGTQNIQPPPPTYFDDISFSKDPAPPPIDAPPVTITPIPTPEMPYYPNMSPWIFIIPVIIILLAAIIFQ